MTYKNRVLLVLLLTILIFCSQIVFGQSKTIQKIVNIKDARLNVALKSKKDKDCLFGPGSIDIDVSGGSGAYTYSWKGPSSFTSSSQNVSNLAAGTYSVTVDDGKDCQSTSSWDVASTCASSCNITATGTVTNASACNTATGSIAVSVSGGSGSYYYAWSDGNYKLLATTKNITNRLPGNYVLQVTDKADSKCTKYFYYTITSPFKATTTPVANTSCSLPFTGGITTTVVGGSGSYSYSWVYPNKTKNTSASLKTLSGGTYQLTIKDNTLGCTLQQTVTVATSNTATLSIASKVTANTLCSPADGAIDITVTKGTGNYTYSWSNTVTSLPAGNAEDLKNSVAGSYSVYVTDTTSKCSATQTNVIPDKVAAYATVDLAAADNVSCSFPFTGGIKATIKGSNGPFSYAWTGNNNNYKSTQQELTGIEPGDYSLLLTDLTTGCTSTAKVTVADKSLPALSVSVDNLTDQLSCKAPDGKVDITIAADAVPYTVVWTDQNKVSYSTEEDIRNLPAGTYTLTATIMCNRAPSVATEQLTLDGKTSVQVNVLELISDADNNLDPTTIAICQKPLSGAKASITSTGMLNLDYVGVSFRGTDNLRIKACDKLGACAENTISIDIDNAVVVYNAVAPNSAGDNKFMRINNLSAQNKVAIYNRWGDLVFEVEDYDNDQRKFNGLTSHGKELPSGTYFYKIETEGAKEPITGYLALKTE